MQTTGLNSVVSWGIVAACSLAISLLQMPHRLASLWFVSFVHRYDTDRQTASHPSTVYSQLKCLGAPLAAYLAEIIGIRGVIIIGCFISSIGVGACYFAEDITQVTLSLGLIYGVGVFLGDSLMPQVQKMYFDENLVNAHGFSLAGACIGALIHPPGIRILMEEYGLSGTFLIVGGIMLNGIPVAMLLKDPKYSSTQNLPKGSIEKIQTLNEISPASENYLVVASKNLDDSLTQTYLPADYQHSCFLGVNSTNISEIRTRSCPVIGPKCCNKLMNSTDILSIRLHSGTDRKEHHKQDNICVEGCKHASTEIREMDVGKFKLQLNPDMNRKEHHDQEDLCHKSHTDVSPKIQAMDVSKFQLQLQSETDRKEHHKQEDICRTDASSEIPVTDICRFDLQLPSDTCRKKPHQQEKIRISSHMCASQEIQTIDVGKSKFQLSYEMGRKQHHKQEDICQIDVSSEIRAMDVSKLKLSSNTGRKEHHKQEKITIASHIDVSSKIQTMDAGKFKLQLPAEVGKVEQIKLEDTNLVSHSDASSEIRVMDVSKLKLQLPSATGRKERPKHTFLTSRVSNASSDAQVMDVSKFKRALRTFLVFKDTPFLVIMLCYSLHIYIVLVVWVIFIDVSRDKGIEESLEVYYLMLLPVAQIIGDCGLGWLTDCGYLTKANYTGLCFVILGLSCAMFAWANSFVTMLLTVLCFGIFADATGVMAPVLVYQFLDENKHNMAIASRYVVYMPLSYSTAPLIGYFRGTLGSYDGILYLLTSISFASGGLMASLPYIANSSKRNRRS